MGEPLKYSNDGVWDGKDWYTYKWVMEAVFSEKAMLGIADGTSKRETLSTAEGTAKFGQMQLQIRRMVGTSVPPDNLQQVKDKKAGTEIWLAVVDLFENKTNATVKVHRNRRLVNELWSMKLLPGGDANLHLCKMFNTCTELKTLQYDVSGIDMVEMMLESLRAQAAFESLKSAVRYGADSSAFTLTKLREMIRAASARKAEFRD
ncbi:hypothetical protein PC128_g21490 [Phytophthora cactorum]|nr:hypothetical protein PC120_g19699 [Phytophthora cactorum]KAG3048413.1 hypothetical protein PC121_g19502 [Phytophthora cactorum]KAG3158517.1 hypothetical protein PC128_g21490 [Phytophthora cactorum]KAG4055737.1 hypothetical protein PC123_g9170 [Phytophthora cactorum]